MNEHCNICPIVNNPNKAEQSRRLIEGEHWVASLREDQQFLGTAFVTLRRHKESPEDLSIAEDRELIEIRNRLVVAQKTSFGAAVVNISCLMNETYRSKKPAPHLHWHFKPRYAPGLVMPGFEDPEFGSYIRRKAPHIPQPHVQQFFAEILKINL